MILLVYKQTNNQILFNYIKKLISFFYIIYKVPFNPTPR